MKVKTAELKANLSRYVRQVRETGEPIEILLRDETVAYLTPTVSTKPVGLEEQAERLRLEWAFAGAGLVCDWASQPHLSLPRPTLAGDGYSDVNSIEVIRAEKNW